MHSLHRSSKRVLFERHLAGFARLALPPLNNRWHLAGDAARDFSIKRFLVLVEDRIHYQGCPLAQHMHDALCHNSSCRREPLDYFTSEVTGEATLSSLVKEAAHCASTIARLNPNIEETGSHEISFLDLAVAEAQTTSTRTYKCRKQHVIELADASTFSKSRHFSFLLCKTSHQNIKRDIHTLPEISVRSSSMNERRQINDDVEFEGAAKEMPQKNIGESTEKQVFKPADNFENLKTGLHRGDKEVSVSQAASKLFVNDKTSILDGNNKEGKSRELFSFHRGDTGLKIAAPCTKKLGHVPRSNQRLYFTVLDKKKKNKRKGKKKRTWDADRHLEPDDLKHLQLTPQLNQIAASGTASCVEKARMHGRADLPNYSLIMSRIVPPVVHHESSGQVDSVDNDLLKMDLKERKRNCSEQEASKQVNCIERAEDENVSQDSGFEEESIRKKHTEPSEEFLCEMGFSKWKGVSKDLGATCEVFSRQTFNADMEPKMHEGSHYLGMIGKGKGTCNENDASSLYQNRGKLAVNADPKASTSLDTCSKGWMSAQIETLEIGVDRDLCHLAGAPKVHYPLGNFNLIDYYVILDLNGVLIKRWDVNPSLPNVSKLNKRWIQLRPGCIEFLCKAFSNFKVGIWSTMRHANVMGVCKLLEQQAHQPLPFFMLWSKDSCYQQRGVRRPDKPHVLADFKPLSHVWRLFQPYLGIHNTVLIDDSPYKACMNNPYNCIFPDAYEGCTDDNYLNDVLWPYLEKMRMSENLQAYIAKNPLGQQPIVVGHKLYFHLRQVMDVFDYHIHPSGTGELIGKI